MKDDKIAQITIMAYRTSADHCFCLISFPPDLKTGLDFYKDVEFH